MNCRVIGTRAKARDYVLAITAVANLVVAGFSPRSIHSHVVQRQTSPNTPAPPQYFTS